MLQRSILDLPELSAATGRSEAWWRRNWLRMHREHRFPRRLSGLWGWPRLAVEAWCRRGDISVTAANENTLPDDADLALTIRHIEQRFGVPQ